jgi:hypothetical protein
MIHSTEGEEPVPCYGQQVRFLLSRRNLCKYDEADYISFPVSFASLEQEIHHKIMSLGFEDCKVYISNVDSQSSAEGGIIVQVIGEMSNAGGPWRKFAQTFFLAEQPNGYFVLNDICRYLKEEGDEAEVSAAAVPATEEVQPESQKQESQPSIDAAPAAVDPLLFDDSPIASASYQEATPVSEVAPAAEEPASANASSDSFTFHTDNSLLAPTANGVSHEEASAPEPVAEGPVETVTKEEETFEVPEEAEEEKPVPAAPETVEETPAVAEAVDEPVAPAPPVPSTAPAPTTSAPPAGPKTWASLAASNAAKWSQISKEHKGVSAAAPVRLSSRSLTPLCR